MGTCQCEMRTTGKGGEGLMPHREEKIQGNTLSLEILTTGDSMVRGKGVKTRLKQWQQRIGGEDMG